jgi:hypothetical protein
MSIPNLLTQFLEGGIGVVVDQLAKAFEVGLIQSRRLSAPTSRGGQRTGLSTATQQPGDEREADEEPAGDRPQRTLSPSMVAATRSRRSFE